MLENISNNTIKIVVKGKMEKNNTGNVSYSMV